MSFHISNILHNYTLILIHTIFEEEVLDFTWMLIFSIGTGPFLFAYKFIILKFYLNFLINNVF